MSPTMTEGGIASWKVKEGDAFTTGDVLVEIETDKATIDVEAQDDGVMAKIIVSLIPRRAPQGARRMLALGYGGIEIGRCGEGGVVDKHIPLYLTVTHLGSVSILHSVHPSFDPVLHSLRYQSINILAFAYITLKPICGY